MTFDLPEKAILPRNPRPKHIGIKWQGSKLALKESQRAFSRFLNRHAIAEREEKLRLKEAEMDELRNDFADFLLG